MSNKKNGTAPVTNLNKKAFSIKEVAEQTTLCTKYIGQLIREGVLPATRFGKRWVILAEDVDVFLHRGVPQKTK